MKPMQTKQHLRKPIDTPRGEWAIKFDRKFCENLFGTGFQREPFLLEEVWKNPKVIKQFIKSLLASLLLQERRKVDDKIEELRKRFRCMACDEKISNLSHTHCCIALTALTNERKEEDSENNPT